MIESSKIEAFINSNEMFRRIKTITEIIERYNLIDIHLWMAFQEEFEDFIENHFNINKIKAEGLRATLRKKEV